MSTNTLNLFCLVDGEATSNAFPVSAPISSTIGELKKLIKAEKTPRFDDVAADELTLWRVSIPNDDGSPIVLKELRDKNNLRSPRTLISSLFKEDPDDSTYIIVQRPPPALKRDREEEEGSSSKRQRVLTLMDAIAEAGLTEVAVVDGEHDLSLLDSKQRVALLNVIGRKVDKTNIFSSLSRTALDLKGTNIKDMDMLSAPRGTKLPVVGTRNLFVRETYKELYRSILKTFENVNARDEDDEDEVEDVDTGDEIEYMDDEDEVENTDDEDEVDNTDDEDEVDNTDDEDEADSTGDEDEVEKQIVVAGTSGIGKSAFLVYLTIRLLAESEDDNPPMIIFHTKRSEKCYVFGGCNIIRSGDIKDFEDFLSLPDTWYLVDSSPDPVLDEAKTVIAASPKTLFSEAYQYQEVDKEVDWVYYMAPWSLEELKACWSCVVSFQVVPLHVVEDLYSKIGGVPRYVLKKPMKTLKRRRNDFQRAKTKACDRLVRALDKVKDPVMLMQFFSQGKDTLEFSSRLIHRWPTDDHSTFRLEWASGYVAERVATLLNEDACTQMLKRLIADPKGSASGIIFEAYVHRTFLEGGHAFEMKDLETGQLTQLHIPQSPQTEHFRTIPSVPADTLCIPRSRNFACVDLLIAPRNLFQITISRRHSINGPLLSELIGSLEQARWISPTAKPRLIFVVPSQVYADFQTQSYLTAKGTVYRRIPADIRRVRQYALKIDLKAAAEGRSPGV